jgi:signal transduction histidine kinase
MPQDFKSDLDAIAASGAVPTILDVVCRSTGMGFAAVARVTEDRWIACSVKDDIGFGLKPGGELKVETTICNEIRESREAVVIDHVATDAHFAQHHTPLMYGFQSYISMPITLPDGSFFGTLCAIDPRPMKLTTPETVGMFKLFADLIAFHLDAHRRIASSTADLVNEKRTAELRDQFIAVLGHDLKNPLASISAGARLLQRKKLDADANGLLDLMQKSVKRMAAIIDDVLDLARGRLGQGISLVERGLHPVEPFIRQVVSELQAGHPARIIDARVAPGIEVRCDRSRLGQLLSNLVANALTHGSSDKPVLVEAGVNDGRFELSVVNFGAPIPGAIQADLFKPFIRGPRSAGEARTSQGLGLGLYISAEIARAHGGTLTVASDATETRFTLSMPAA